ncbi:hypothetical protein BDZ97DRAFT_1918999 [Flammula alnicola]|nr:hypothetical protein BDZ97DRAFT_1918999 [Flammula alnicola]
MSLSLQITKFSDISAVPAGDALVISYSPLSIGFDDGKIITISLFCIGFTMIPTRPSRISVESFSKGEIIILTIVSHPDNYEVVLNGHFLGSTKRWSNLPFTEFTHVRGGASAQCRVNAGDSVPLEPLFVAVFRGAEARSDAISYAQDPAPWSAPRSNVADRERHLADKQQDLETKGEEVAERERKVEEEEENIAHQQKELAFREEVVRESERRVKERENLVAERDADVYGDGSDNKHPRANIRPLDYPALEIATSTAWPAAVTNILRARVGNIVIKRHKTFMNNWVRERGDNIDEDAYDYLVYSHGVAWPKAILQEPTEEAKFLLIRSQFLEIMKDVKESRGSCFTFSSITDC